ncbi:MAG TPA: DUF1634 domain-containing protein [Solirubrobacteraceae bacterium]|nr:DUF1634 domain-containing protein [Solirubrobacteraceae bacterium]
MTGSPAVSSFERALARAMLAGVWLSAAALAAGLSLALARPQAGTGRLLLSAGLMVLMGTPVLRVVLSVAEAIRQRDWFWLWTTLAVAVVLSATVAYSFRAAR